MCGIAGFWDPGLDASDRERRIRLMTDAIRHRGPDDAGLAADDPAGPVLGHRRLSVLDLSPCGHQPMASQRGRYQIVFNGEIYNFVRLRDELAGSGARFRGHSDTEVLLAAFDRWGVLDTLPRLVGMFAFAVWDAEARRLHVARDRMGEKPLYVGRVGQALVFASELKAVRAYPGFAGEVDRAALGSYLRHAYVPAPHCIYRGFRKVMPGTALTFAAPDDAEPVETTYWSVRDAATRGLANPLDLSDADAVDACDALLRSAIADQMIADVSLGAFLSGGIDSTTIVALMQAQSPRPVRTFSIGFHEEAFNEAHHARAVAEYLGADHTELYVTPGDALAVVPTLPAMYDEPFGDSSQVPTHLVAAMARRHVTVSLSGDGADELFGGYNRYVHAARLWSLTQRLGRPGRRIAAGALASLSPARWESVFRAAGRVSRRARNVPQPGDRLHKLARMLRVDSQGQLYRELFSQWSSPGDLVLGADEAVTVLDRPDLWPAFPSDTLRALYLDQLTYLPDDILQKVDRAAMATSLETRAPFLDHRVVEFSWRLPLHQKIRGAEGKWVLRRVLDRYVPSAMMHRPKMGFSIPVDRWLRGPLRDWAADLLDPARLEADAYLAAAPLQHLWREHERGSANWGFRLWPVLMFQAWLRDAAPQRADDVRADRVALAATP